MDFQQIARIVMKHAEPKDILFANSSIISQGIAFYMPEGFIHRAAWTEWNQLSGRPGVENIWLILIPEKGETPPIAEVLASARARGFTITYQRNAKSLRVLELTLKRAP